MRSRLTLILVLLIQLNSSSSLGQEYPFVNYTPTDGLVNNRCRFMFQDRKGRLFIATFGGLSVYDGSRFTNYTTDNGLSVSLINDIVEMGEDSIWIIPNNNKIHCLVNGRMKNVVTADNFYPIVNKLIKCSDGFYYAIADDGLYRFADNRFVRINLTYENGEELNSYFIKGTEIDGKLFIITDPSTNNFPAAARLVIFDLKTHKTLLSKKPPGISYVAESPQKDILVSIAGGIKRLNRDALRKGEILLERLPVQYRAAEKVQPSHIYFDRQENWWLSTFSGVFKLDKEGVLKEFNTHNGLPVNSIASVFQDKENILWFLNTETGMSKLSTPNFESYNLLRPGFLIIDLYADKQSDSVWFVDAGHRKVLLHDQNGFKEFLIQHKKALGNRIVVGQNGKGYLCDNYSIYQFSIPKIGNVLLPRHFYSHSTNLMTGISCLATDKKGNLIFASNDSLRAFSEKELIASHLLGSMADQFVLTQDNHLWIVTRGAELFHFQIRPDEPGRYLELIRSYEKELVGISPRSITIDKEHNVWMGTRDHGLFRYSFDQAGNVSSRENITSKNGLSDNFINYLHCDDEGIIWACTPAGLDKVQVINGKMLVENITRAYNLFQYVSKISSDKKGIHWVNTSVGVVNKIEPSFSLSKNFLPKISFSEIKTGKDTIVTRGKKVFLPYRENQMTFNLAAPSFINEKQTHFSYRLEGSTNSAWTEPSSNSEIRFVNLAPGDYKLHVKATFPGGLYPVTTNEFHFEILPPWWQTLWFRLMLIGTAVLITIFFVRLYFRRKIEKQRIIMEKQQVIELERRRIAGEMHDDLGAGLSNIRFLSEKVKRESGNTDTQFDAEKLVNNSNDLAQKMNEIIWAMNEKNDTLEALIFYTRAYAMEYCEENKISCKTILPDSIPEKFVSGEIRRNIFLTVKESLHNVVKHSGASTVLIEFKLDKSFSVRIIDNGKGINGKSNSLYGNGLVNMQSRISMLKGTLNIRSANGVTVEFSVPLT